MKGLMKTSSNEGTGLGSIRYMGAKVWNESAMCIFKVVPLGRLIFTKKYLWLVTFLQKIASLTSLVSTRLGCQDEIPTFKGL